MSQPQFENEPHPCAAKTARPADGRATPLALAPGERATKSRSRSNPATFEAIFQDEHFGWCLNGTCFTSKNY
jgi:hypothetical protein